MITTYDYYTDGRPYTVEYPDGNWVLYEYNDYGLLEAEYRPLQSTGTIASTTGSKKTTYTYTSLSMAT